MQEFNSALLRFNADVCEFGKNLRYIKDGNNRITFGAKKQDFIIDGVSKLTISSSGVNLGKIKYLTPNGVNDNVQIQSAIDSLGATGGKIQLSAGIFVCLATINILGITVNNILIEGCGDSTLVDFRATGWVDGFNIVGTDQQGLDENFRIKLRNFRVIAGAGGQINDGIYQFYVSDGSIENVRISDCTYGVYINACYNYNIIGVVADENTYSGIKIQDSHDMMIMGAQCEANGNHGIYINRGVNICCVGCTSEDNTEDGINITTISGIHNAAPTVISGCTTDGNRDGIRVTGVNGVAITGNTFGRNVQNEIHLIGSHRNTIVGNNIQAASTPIKLVGSSENKIMGNSYMEVTTIDIDSYSHNNIIEQGLNGDTTIAYGTPVTIENCEDNWVAKANVTSAIDSDNSDHMVGDNAVKLTVAGAFTTGLIATEDFGAKDLTDWDKVGFWIKSNIDIAADVLQICLDNTAACASPLETLNIPALTTDIWQFVELSLGTPANLGAVISVGLNAASDPGECIIYIDNITTERPKCWYDASAQELNAGLYAKVKSGINGDGEESCTLESTKSVDCKGSNAGFYNIYNADSWQLYVRLSDGRLNSKGGITISNGGENAAIGTTSAGSASTTLYAGNETIDTTPVSDEKYKEDVKDTVCSITDLEKIAVRDFRFTADYTEDHSVQTGMIAQEVQQIYPYAVKENHFKGGDTIIPVEAIEALDNGKLKYGYYKDKDGSYYKMENILEEKVLVVNYKKIIPLLIKSVQDLNDKIKILEAK